MKKTKNVFDIIEDDDDAIASFRSKKKPKTPRSNRTIQITDPDTTPPAPELSSDRIAYIYSKEAAELTSKLPTNEGRSFRVHSLIQAYNLFEKMRIISPPDASVDDLTEFHSERYIKFLQKSDGKIVETITSRSTDTDIDAASEKYGLQDDCPLFENVFDYVTKVAGGTLQAAEELVSGKSNIAVNWDGDQASGFCYVNDIVLGIYSLLNKFDRVLYIDIDIHHGDGVEHAFYQTDKVFTLSFHHHSTGFYPGTGAIERTGEGQGLHHNLNIPLLEGMDDATYTDIFQKIANRVNEVYDPQVIVLCCGADGLTSDRLGNFNLTPLALGNCLKIVKQWNKKMLVLGGGGYHTTNVARCWTYLTNILIGGPELDRSIPEHEFYEEYGSDFVLPIRPGNRANKNSKEDLQKLIDSVFDLINLLKE